MDQVLRQLEKPATILSGSDSLSLDGENSSDCGVVPSIDREHLDTGGFNLLADKVGYTDTPYVVLSACCEKTSRS